MIEPGATIGIVGGGQLGRMLAMAAAQLGYRCHVYSPEASGPASEVAATWTQGAYDDRAKLTAFGASVDVATYEFENVAADPLEAIAASVPLYPPLSALRVAQDRVSEKQFAAEHGARTARWTAVDREDELAAAMRVTGLPAILKTTRFGYDGKGQARLDRDDEDELATAWRSLHGRPAILEGFVAFEHEFSIVLARGQDGASAHWDAAENRHHDGILDTSTVPAHPQVLACVPQARAVAERIAAALGYVGVLSVEFFATADGPVFNEMAPRVHNSGHWTIEGAETSQFENHIRAICGLPLGSTALTRSGAEMTNLIGEDAHRWPELLSEPGAHVHLYGKAVRAGRKMGHVTRLR